MVPVATNESRTAPCCPHHDRLHLADRIRGAAERLAAALKANDFLAQIRAEEELDRLKARARDIRVAA